jgi:putative ABC transport system ATP-binding protein
VIELNSVHRIFQVGDQEVHALNDVSLTISAGEYVSLMGPSGSGKSTLLNILGLLDKPTEGGYVFDGRNTTALTDEEQAAVRGRKIGFVFQFFHLVPRLTATENIELPMMLAGIMPAERQTRVKEALQDVGIEDRARHRPDQLSGGQRQRVAIARATIMRPSVLLADEPTGNLDRASGKDVIDILERLNSNGITLIIVTHDPEIGGRAGRQLKMVDGRFVSDNQKEIADAGG